MSVVTVEKDSFKKMTLLTAARIFGIFFSFVIPMYLGRSLEIQTYGTYKQLMLFFWFAQVALNLGFDDSAYYYLRWDRKNFPLYSFNALIFNVAITSVLWLALCFFNFEIAGWINNPEIAQYLPWLGFLIMLTVSSMQAEGILIGLNRFKERLALEMGMELFKSVAILGAFYFFSSVKFVLIFLSCLMFFRLILTAGLIHHYKKKELLQYLDSLKHFVSQARFGLPLGVSRVFQNLLNMENFIISSFFSMIEFTFYSVGSFENPLINAFRQSLNELVNIEMVDAIKKGSYQDAVEVWRRMTRKLFLVVVPFVAYMMFFSKEIITFIFSEKYLESVPYFIIFNIYILIGSVNPEPLFRATSQTKKILKIKVIGVVLGVLTLLIAAKVYGPMAVLVGKILIIFTINLVSLKMGASLIQSSIFRMFQWNQFFGVLLVSVGLSVGLRVLFSNLNWPPFYVLAVSFSIYGLLHFLISWKVNLIKEDEIRFLKNLLERFLIKPKARTS